MTDLAIALLVFGIPAVLGIRATWRLWRLVAFDGTTRSQPILIAFAIIATLITAAALFFGILALRRAFGFEPLGWTGPVSILVAALVLLIPAGLERLVVYIGDKGGTP